MIVRSLATALVLTAAPAGACPPAVKLDGDDSLITTIADELRARGIETDATECPVVMVYVERRDQSIVVRIATAQSIEREVREVATAAAVIESFTRDLASPLLAIRRVPRVAALARLDVPPPPPPTGPRGLHVFAGLESLYASDRSNWLGLHVGGCKMFGVVCLAGRMRTSSVIGIGEMQTRRQSWEILFGIDIPFAIGGWLISPGFGGGPSGTVTRNSTGGFHHTIGLRAEAHATVSIPLTLRFSLDVHAALNLLQPLHVEDAGYFGPPPPVTPPPIGLPAEPWGYARMGLALRYGTR